MSNLNSSTIPITPKVQMKGNAPNILLLVREVLKKYNIFGCFPIDVLKIAFGEGIHVIKNSDIHDLKSGEYGKMYYNFDRDKTIFIYDDSQTVDSSRFTIAHELGHYFLNHKDVLDRGDRDFEKEADLFSTYLLMRGNKV